MAKQTTPIFNAYRSVLATVPTAPVQVICPRKNRGESRMMMTTKKMESAKRECFKERMPMDFDGNDESQPLFQTPEIAAEVDAIAVKLLLPVRSKQIRLWKRSAGMP